MTDLNGKTALVTGGGRGLGAAICRDLAEAGVTVIAADVQERYARQVADEAAGNGGRVIPMSLDVSVREQVEKAVESIVAEHRSLDILINNAGVDVTLPVEELAVEEWDHILAVNLRGPFLTARSVLPFMKRQGGGSIVNVASTAAKRAWPNASAYHASKWGLLGFSHALHSEARPFNIKVTALVVGGMRTPFLLERFPDIDISTLQDPANVASAVRFILSQPPGTVLSEVMVLPMRETSWP